MPAAIYWARIPKVFCGNTRPRRGLGLTDDSSSADPLPPEQRNDRDAPLPAENRLRRSASDREGDKVRYCWPALCLAQNVRFTTQSCRAGFDQYPAGNAVSSS